MNKQINPSVNIIVSDFLLLFFTTLVALSYFKIDTSGITILLELITIPLLLIALTVLVYNFISWNKENWSLSSSHVIPTISLVVCASLLILATVFNI